MKTTSSCAALPQLISNYNLVIFLTPPPKSHPQLMIRSRFPCWASKPRITKRRISTILSCHKMYVPDGFFKGSPEQNAANYLNDFFTYVAVRIVAAQLESYNPEAYKELMGFVEGHSLNDGDKFCAAMMRESSRHKALALRILEVRSTYCKNDFEWENLKRLACKTVDESNTKLMREYVVETSSSSHSPETDNK